MTDYAVVPFVAEISASSGPEATENPNMPPLCGENAPLKRKETAGGVCRTSVEPAWREGTRENWWRDTGRGRQPVQFGKDGKKESRVI